MCHVDHGPRLASWRAPPQAAVRGPSPQRPRQRWQFQRQPSSLRSVVLPISRNDCCPCRRALSAGGAADCVADMRVKSDCDAMGLVSHHVSDAAVVTILPCSHALHAACADALEAFQHQLASTSLLDAVAPAQVPIHRPARDGGNSQATGIPVHDPARDRSRDTGTGFRDILRCPECRARYDRRHFVRPVWPHCK